MSRGMNRASPEARPETGTQSEILLGRLRLLGRLDNRLGRLAGPGLGAMITRINRLGIGAAITGGQGRDHAQPQNTENQSENC